MVRNATYRSYWKKILAVLRRWNRIFFFLQILMKFHNKEKRTIYFESSISHLFDELHFSPILHMNQIKHIFQDIPLYCNNKVKKPTINCFTFVTVVKTTSWCLFRPWYYLKSCHIPRLRCSLCNNTNSSICISSVIYSGYIA